MVISNHFHNILAGKFGCFQSGHLFTDCDDIFFKTFDCGKRLHEKESYHAEQNCKNTFEEPVRVYVSHDDPPKRRTPQ